MRLSHAERRFSTKKALSFENASNPRLFRGTPFMPKRGTPCTAEAPTVVLGSGL
jgi:hypothetical protein